MSRAVSVFLLHALIDDFSSIPRSHASSGLGPPGRPVSPQVVGSPAVGCRAVHADHRPAAIVGTVPRGEDGLPVLIHGSAPRVLAAWRSLDAAGPGVGLDIAQERDRHCIESVHRTLARLTELPRRVPVIVGLALDPGWRDALDLIRSRGRTVRFAGCGVSAPDSPALVEAIRAAASLGCIFSWSCGPWGAVSDPWASPLPGILNVLLATGVALHGGSAAEVAAELGRGDPVDVVDAVCELDEATARRIRALLNGFAVHDVAGVVDALSALDLLPKARPEAQQGAER